MKKVLAPISWYSGNMLANSLVGLLVVPVVIGVVGPNEWGAIAVGQSIGSIATIFVALGWGYNGPSLIARSSPADRTFIAIQSVVARSLVAPPVIILAALIAAGLAPVAPHAAVLACIGVSLGGLGMSWYFVGQGHPRSLFMLDGLPRWLGSLLGVGALAMTQNILLLLWFQLLGSVVSSALSVAVVLSEGSPVASGAWKIRAAFRGMKNQLYAGVTVITATSFAALPTLIIAALAPASVPIYALGERLLRVALMAITPFSQWAQGWVPKENLSQPLDQRIKRVVLVSVCLGIPVGLSVALLGPLAGKVLSAGVLELPYALTGLLGVAVALSTVSRVVGMACLLAVGRERGVALSAMTAALIGTPLLFALVAMHSSVGAAAALAVSESIVLGIQLFVLRRWFHGHPPEKESCPT